MSYISKTLAILASSLVLTGCGLQQYVKHTDVSAYPYRYADFDYKYAWKTALTDHGFAIDGVMKNVRYSFIDSTQLTVLVLGKEGNIVARTTTFPMPQQTREGDVSQFSLLLSNFNPTPHDVIQFRVHYSGNEGGNNAGIDWISSFKIEAMTGAVIHGKSRNPDEW